MPEVGGVKENIGPLMCPFSPLFELVNSEAKYTLNPLNAPVDDRLGSRWNFSTRQSRKKSRLRVYSAPRPENTQ